MIVNQGLKIFLNSIPRKEKKQIVFQIIQECDFSVTSFSQKRYGRTDFSKLEKEKISEIIKIPVDQLFCSS